MTPLAQWWPLVIPWSLAYPIYQFITPVTGCYVLGFGTLDWSGHDDRTNKEIIKITSNLDQLTMLLVISY